VDRGSERPLRPSQGLTELIGRALTDESFRNVLFEDRARAIEPFRLTPTDLVALDSLSRETLEEHANRFGQGSAAGLTIGIEIKGSF
jgi:hypothetical protein